MPPPGNLYIIPSPIHNDYAKVLLPDKLIILNSLRHFVVENTRTSRRFIKLILPEFDINSAVFYELDKHQSDQPLKEPIQVLLAGYSMGLLSEAGCPGVADPGSNLVAEAHRHQIKVIPWIGPSSILLGLMASGMNGQRFNFHGYLPHSKPDLSIKLKQLEAESFKWKSTQLFIETPYRNQALMQSLLQELKSTTHLCVVINLTGPDELILRHTIWEWKQAPAPPVHKKTTLFLIEA
ncbi:MAG: SAM-dependent methyltransferase [Saprospiraceae bacterium]|nr:SAM-dependent methyltransferase [Saprospiraceae bacterium]